MRRSNQPPPYIEKPDDEPPPTYQHSVSQGFNYTTINANLSAFPGRSYLQPYLFGNLPLSQDFANDIAGKDYDRALAYRTQLGGYIADTNQAKSITDVARFNREERDRIFSEDLLGDDPVKQVISNVSTINQSVVNRQLTVRDSNINQALNQGVINRYSPEQSQSRGFFIPLVIGAIIGAVAGTATHLAFQGSSTAGLSAVAENYHLLGNHAFNSYQSTQSDPNIGQSYAGYHNYLSSMAYLNDAKEHAAPWMNFGAHAALNHFTSTNDYDRIGVTYNSGYIYQ